MATIRAMTEADFPAVAAMANEAAARALVGRPLWETAGDVAAELSTLSQATFIVAEDDAGQVIGLAGYSLTEDGEARLYGPLVTTEGHGIGAWLETRVVSMAQHQGATSFSMLIGLGNRSGQAWAQWRGYQQDTEQPELLLTWLYPGEMRTSGLTGAGEVRRAGLGDLDAIAALLQECFPRERSHPSQWLDQCWVIEVEGQVLGFLTLEWPTAWIRHLCIHPAMRRRGLGAKLLVQVIERFWAEDSRKVGLAVPLDDTAPVTLLRRLGFRREVPVATWMKR
jgi:N-acetylglutamate synthase-like GNAT family acetyltransferase